MDDALYGGRRHVGHVARDIAAAYAGRIRIDNPVGRNGQRGGHGACGCARGRGGLQEHLDAKPAGVARRRLLR